MDLSSSAYLFWVTLRLWAFWGWGAALIALVLRRYDYDWWDAALGGLGGMWVAALAFGLTFGLVGLFYTPILWVLLFAGTVMVSL